MKDAAATTATRMPAVFFGHGSPMNALEDNRYTQSWQRLGRDLPRPKAIVMVSAHWTTRGTLVTAMDKPRTIHDFGGFPQPLFDMRYPAPGSLDVARQVQQALAPVAVGLDADWGLDHGTWSVLVKAYPGADIPVLQLSIDATRPPSYHFELGRKLAALRDEGVLIAASGNVVHNLGKLIWEEGKAHDWALRFNERVRGHLLSGDYRALADYAQWGDDARLSVPTAEHYLPLLYVLGAAHDGETLTLETDEVTMGAISMLTVVVGAQAGARKD